MTDTLPTWEQCMVPTLRVLGDGTTRNRRDLVKLASDGLGLDEAQRAVMLNSGQPTHENRIGWAISQLSRVGALAKPARAQYRITEAGREVLAAYPHGITAKELDALGQDPASAIRPYEASTPVKRAAPATLAEEETTLDPNEQIEQGVARIHETVAKELLERLRSKEPAFFERAVIDLLVAMGYGGTGGVAAATRLVNDGGIDGIIDQDVLGLNKVYVQAKRYAAGNAVGRPDLQGFVGALIGQADRGVFITTSTFTPGAIDYARHNTSTRLILIDGNRLTELMIRYGVGVQAKETFRVVEVDEDFFE